MSLYKVGDQVVCTNRDSTWYNEHGVVLEANSHYVWVDYMSKDKRSQSTVHTHENHVALVPKANPELKFKAGDKVRIVKGVFVGKVGVIRKSDGTRHYDVDVCGTRNLIWFQEDFLELFEEEADPYAELKKAKDEGKTIQIYSTLHKEWCDIVSPTWQYPPDQYRVKPESEHETGYQSIWCPVLDVIAAKAGVGKTVVNQPTKKEMKMKFETKHYLNGNDISTLSNKQIFEFIAEEEHNIKELKKIDTKPKRITDEITKRSEELNRLVNFLDAQDGEA